MEYEEREEEEEEVFLPISGGRIRGPVLYHPTTFSLAVMQRESVTTEKRIREERRKSLLETFLNMANMFSW